MPRPRPVVSQQIEEMQWHSLDEEELFKVLETSRDGITHEEAQKRILKYGANKIEAVEKYKIAKMIIEQFTNFLVILLIIAGIISLLLGLAHAPGGEASELIDAIAIFAIVIINAIIGFTQDYHSNQALDKLKEYFEQEVIVTRHKEEHIIPSHELVPGDLISLEIGNKVPADCRLIDVHSLKVDEAPLTGESKPVKKVEVPVPFTARIHERTCMLFMGTTCVYGRGKAIVTSTGMKTEMGKIAAFTETKKEMTPLQQSLEKLGKILGGIILLICFLVMAVDMILLGDPFESFETAIALAISAVPEGLTAAIIITYAIGVSRMAKKKTIVAHLPSVETLGSVDYICSDKTGTITRNEMTVKELWTWEGPVFVEGSGYISEGKFKRGNKNIDPRQDETLDLLLETSYNCNNAAILRVHGKFDVVGDPTEACLIVVAEKAGYNQAMKNERVWEIFFDSERKRMTTINKKKGNLIAYCKGSPPVVYERCKHVLKGGKVETLTQQDIMAVEAANLEMSNKALRVLAFAIKYIPGDFSKDNDEAIENDMIFVGLAGMIDPPPD